MRWWFMVPDAFRARWTGYLIVERSGLYTFQTISNGVSQLTIGREMVVDNPGAPGANGSTGTIRLERGAHRILLESVQRNGPYVFEWAWSRDGDPLTPVPGLALSEHRRDPLVASIMRWLPSLWLAMTVVCALPFGLAAASYWRGRSRHLSGRDWIRLAGCSVAIAALATFYVLGATEHARRVNISKARADQSGYLRDAQEVYANWHGQEPPGLVGMRNRMPLYAAYQALFWDPAMTNDEFFEHAKIWNIRLSLVLLLVLGIACFHQLPRLIAANLLLIAAFGWFIFKAGYTQSELLFYTLFFLTFLGCCHLLRPSSRPRLLLASLTGIVAALAHLTKAAALPLVVIFIVVWVGRELALTAARPAAGGGHGGAAASIAAGRWAAGAVMLIAFLVVLYPYISTNKRLFGQYFYNVNTTFYVWYDDWATVSGGTILHGDDSGWPGLPPSEIPSMGKYLRTHSISTILERFAGGAQDMIVRSYQTHGYLKYMVLYVAFAAALVAANRRATVTMIAGHQPLFAFLLLYAVVHLLAIAFYSPISGTGTTRFLLAHAMPLMFTLSYFFARRPFRDTTWVVAGVTATPAHFHLLVLVTIGLDLSFTLWPRLMSTYGGF
jgi:hypothetical protein